MITREYEFTSSNGKSTVYAVSYAPQGRAKAAVQVLHGMLEHGGRYRGFAEYMCGRGYMVFIHDHIGHGLSAPDEGEAGYFAAKGGARHLVRDAKIMTNIIKLEYPRLPCFLLGSGTGSFIARAYAGQFSDALAGAVFCGTGGYNPSLVVASSFTNMLALFKGPKARSDLADKLAFGHFNRGISRPATGFDWMSGDPEAVRSYIEDEKCGNILTLSAYRDLFWLIKNVSSGKWYKKVPPGLPILMLAGREDPLGEYGRGVKAVYKRLKKTGHKSIKLKIFENDRHDLLNETDRIEVFEAILNWMDGVL